MVWWSQQRFLVLELLWGEQLPYRQPEKIMFKTKNNHKWIDIYKKHTKSHTTLKSSVFVQNLQKQIIFL